MKLIALFLIAGACISSAAPLQLTLPIETVKLKEGAGSELVAAQCLICHSADYFSTQPPLSRTYWQNTVVKMQQKFGAPLPAQDVDAIVGYLTANYGTPAAGK